MALPTTVTVYCVAGFRARPYPGVPKAYLKEFGFGRLLTEAMHYKECCAL